VYFVHLQAGQKRKGVVNTLTFVGESIPDMGVETQGPKSRTLPILKASTKGLVEGGK
jgi:hypothetical protein